MKAFRIFLTLAILTVYLLSGFQPAQSKTYRVYLPAVIMLEPRYGPCFDCKRP